jgi:hypothetical protein
MAKVQSDFYFRWAQSRIQATYTANQVLDSLIEYAGVDTTLGAVQITLPDSSGSDVLNGKIIFIIDQGNAGTNNISVIPNGSDGTTIDGLSRLDITSDDEVVAFQLTDSNWSVLGKRGIKTLKSVTTTYTALQTDELVIGDTTGGAFPITLPTAVGIKGRTIIIKKLSGAAPQLTINTTGAQTIDGNASIIISGSGGLFVAPTSDGANWILAT